MSAVFVEDCVGVGESKLARGEAISLDVSFPPGELISIGFEKDDEDEFPKSEGQNLLPFSLPLLMKVGVVNRMEVALNTLSAIFYEN